MWLKSTENIVRYRYMEAIRVSEATYKPTIRIKPKIIRLCQLFLFLSLLIRTRDIVRRYLTWFSQVYFLQFYQAFTTFLWLYLVNPRFIKINNIWITSIIIWIIYNTGSKTQTAIIGLILLTMMNIKNSQ